MFVLYLLAWKFWPHNMSHYGYLGLLQNTTSLSWYDWFSLLWKEAFLTNLRMKPCPERHWYYHPWTAATQETFTCRWNICAETSFGLGSQGDFHTHISLSHTDLPYSSTKVIIGTASQWEFAKFFITHLVGRHSLYKCNMLIVLEPIVPIRIPLPAQHFFHIFCTPFSLSQLQFSSSHFPLWNFLLSNVWSRRLVVQFWE